MTDPETATFLKSTSLFANVDCAVLEQLVPVIEPRKLVAGEILMREGEPGDRLFFVRAGRLLATACSAEGVEVVLREILPGMSVGEIAVLTGGKRSATVTAAEPADLLCMTREQFEQLGRSHPLVMAEITQAIVRRLQEMQLNQAFRVNTLLAGLDEAVAAEVRQELELFTLPAGQDLMQEGEPSDALYIIVNGRLRAVTKSGSGEEVVLLDLGRGQTVGEMGLITGASRSARVYAVRDSLLARFSKAGFDRVLSKHPEAVMRHFAGAVIQRLQGQIKGEYRAVRDLTTFAIISATEGCDLDGFADQLAHAFRPLGDTLLLSAARVDDALLRPGMAQVTDTDPRNLNLVRWLGEVEAQHRYVIYVADRGPTNWTKRCLRQADRAILVAEVGPASLAGQAASALQLPPEAFPTPRRTLILVHPSNTVTPRGTCAWLDLSGAKLHYHVRAGRRQDFGRLARLLTGRGIGFALSGGGARGLAHVGALHALREAGVPVDVVGGTSAGGWMAAQQAMGWDHERIMEINRSATRQKFDYTLPIMALMAGRAMTDVVTKMFGDTQIEDLWLPFFCMSANITRSSLITHERGPVWKAVRATTSLPGVLPPVMEQGDMLVDGGVINNLPTDIMRQREDVGTVFAFDVSGSGDKPSNRPPAYESYLSGWRVLWNRINPFAAPLAVPSLPSVMMRMALISKSQSERNALRLADFYVRLSPGDYGLLDFQALDDIVARGYRSAQESLAAWSHNKQFQDLIAA